MKVPKLILMTAAVIAPAYVLSILALAATHHPATKAQHLALGTISTSHMPKQAALGETTTASAQQSTTANTVTSTTTHNNAHPTTPPPTLPPSSTPNNQQPNNPPKPVTPVSATLSDWQNNGGTIYITVGGPGDSYISQRQYCIYAYSDGSTKQVLYSYRKWDTTTNTLAPNQGYAEGGTVVIPNPSAPTFTCDISTAPAPN